MAAFAVSITENPTRYPSRLEQIEHKIEIEGRKIIVHCDNETIASQAVSDAGFLVAAVRTHESIEALLRQCDDFRRDRMKAA